MKQRVITALIAAPIVLALIFATNPIPIFILAIVAVFLATDELVWLAKGHRSWIPYAVAAVFIATGWVLRDHYDGHRERIVWGLGITLVTAVTWMLYEMRKGRDGRLLLPGILWLFAPFMGLLLLHYSVPKTRVDVLWPNPLLMAIVPIWAGDIMAILIGKKFGKTPLAPKLSPKKTWEGAIANFVTCVGASVLLASSIGLTINQGLLVGLVAGVLGQAGDLFESAIKRIYDAKDSGWILPGHGGLLDRLDSLLLPALPITALILFYR